MSRQKLVPNPNPKKERIQEEMQGKNKTEVPKETFEDDTPLS